MRRGHFSALEPLCPLCRHHDDGRFALRLVSVFSERDGHILEGLLQCSRAACRREYPIVEGIPILVRDVRSYVQDHLLEILKRDAVAAPLESLLGDCCGPGSPYDTWRQHRSTYGSSHYGDLWRPQTPAAPDGPGADDSAADDSGTDRAAADSLLGLYSTARRLLGEAVEGGAAKVDGPTLDLGCAVGRTGFELARDAPGLVLGVDLHFGMLRLAACLLRGEDVAIPRRRSGVVYSRQRCCLRSTDLWEAAEDLDFWACDALALPFAEASFAAVGALNVLDCLASPLEGLRQMADVLKPSGHLWLSSPYDWSTGATPFEGWLGGHSDRGDDGGHGDLRLRALLEEPSVGLELQRVAEARHVPWRLRLHDRSVMEYSVDVMALRRRDDRSNG